MIFKFLRRASRPARAAALCSWGSKKRFSTLPVVDISPCLNGLASDTEKQQVVKAVHEACRDIGFLYITGHQVDPKLSYEMLRVSREFFMLPLEEKMKISINNSKTYRGYQRIGQNVTQNKRDWHEGIDYFAEPEGCLTYNPKKPLHGPNQWPEQPLSFRKTTEEYLACMDKLGNELMSIFAQGLGLPYDYFLTYTDNPFWILRVIGYPPGSTVDGGMDGMEVGDGCGIHTDYGCLTIVNQDAAGGLEVQTVDGRWIEGKPVDGAFAINIGDMLSHWTNGLLKSTPHRVNNKSKEYRVSVPFFFEPNYDAMISPMKALKNVANTKGSGLGSQPIKYGDHLASKILNNFDFSA